MGSEVEGKKSRPCLGWEDQRGKRQGITLHLPASSAKPSIGREA